MCQKTSAKSAAKSRVICAYYNSNIKYLNNMSAPSICQHVHGMSWLSCIISFHFHPHSKCWRCQWVWRGDNSGSMSHPISLMVVHVCANQKHRLPLGQLLRMPLPPLSKGTAAAWDICAESDLEKDSAPRKNLSPTPEAHRDGNTGYSGQRAAVL